MKDIHTDRQTDTHTHRQTDTHTHTHATTTVCLRGSAHRGITIASFLPKLCTAADYILTWVSPNLRSSAAAGGLPFLFMINTSLNTITATTVTVIIISSETIMAMITQSQVRSETVPESVGVGVPAVIIKFNNVYPQYITHKLLF